MKRTGLPEVDALIEVHETEQGTLDETIVISQAGGTVASARHAELAAQQKAAWHRLTAAKGLLTTAQKDGNDATVAAAWDRRGRAYAEFERISDAAVDEMRQINGARLDRLRETLEQTRRAWDTRSAVADAPATRRTSPVAGDGR